MERRRFARIAAAASGGVALLGSGWLVVRAWLPWITPRPDGSWSIGTPDRFPAGTATLLRRAKSVIVNDGTGLHALSAICTHEGCTLHDLPARKELTCPCHGAAFDYEGRVKRGPTNRNLDWLSLRREGDELVLDPSKVVEPF